MKKILLAAGICLALNFSTFAVAQKAITVTPLSENIAPARSQNVKWQQFLQACVFKCVQSEQELAQMLKTIDQTMLNLKNMTPQERALERQKALRRTALTCMRVAKTVSKRVSTASLDLAKRSASLLARYM